MTHQKTHHQMVCEMVAETTCQEIMEFLTGEVAKSSRALVNTAIAAAIPKGAELTVGQETILKSIRAKVAVAAMSDQKMREEVHGRAHALAMRIMNESGARELFGYIEDVANDKSSATKERAQRLYDQYHPDAEPKKDD